ncbi:type I restriction endonuclease, partial [Shewanella frigidimarina]|uniref:type I restriction endonuclease n=1 Tax=Shewanella frigidimarina TaxID=56812 RepID=UPI003F9FFFC1
LADSKIWEDVATEQEALLNEYRAKMDAANLELRTSFQAKDQKAQAKEIKRVEKLPFHMDEAETRILIDKQLNDAGWKADTVNFRYSKKVRPVANENRAIAEWPTKSGPADYVLFMGLIPVAVVEAKKSAKNVYGSIDQAKRYAKGLETKNAFTIETTWGDFKVPLTFATNGRPYLK